ncbi:hypothetical protein LTR95_013889, partial [Oleoguttula sp. CCFEE 5521]
MSQTLLMPRQPSSSDYSILTLTLVAGLLASNAIAIAVFVESVAQLHDRLRYIFLLNIIPLWTSRRAPWIIDNVVGVAPETYAVAHRALGWVLTALAFQAGISLVFIRRRFFEVFLRLHGAFAIVTLGATWALDLNNISAEKWETICKALATGLGIISVTIWLLRFIWLNRASHGDNASIRTLDLYTDPSRGVVGAIQLQVRIKRSLRIRPGQFLSITLPSIPNTLLGYTQSHPYLVAWTESSQEHGDHV